MLDVKQLKKQLGDVDIIYFESIGSTNDYVKQIDVNNARPLLCLADLQTQGRGQYDRVWHSPKYENIYLSLRVTLPININKLHGLSLVVGISVCQVLAQLYPSIAEQLSLKWPNDIYLNGKKLGGVLIEIVKTNKQSCDVVIGIGINVFMQQAANQIDQAWASIIQCATEVVQREAIIIALVHQMQLNMQLLVQHGFNYFMSLWQDYDYLTNKSLTIKSSEQIYNGQYVGVDDQGCLVIKMLDNQTMALISANILNIV